MPRWWLPLAISSLVLACNAILGNELDDATATDGGGIASGDGDGGTVLGPDGAPLPRDGSASDAGGDGSTPVDRYGAVVLADGPVGWLRLDDDPAGDTGRVLEQVSGQLIGFVHGTPTRRVPGALAGSTNAAMELTGTEWIDLGDRFGFSGLQPFTVEVWIKPVSPAPFAHLITKQDRTGGNTTGWALWRDQGAAGKAERLVDSVGSKTQGTSMPAGVWQHLAMTYDGALRLYKDGVLVGTPVQDTATLPPNVKALVIGASNPDGADLYKGTIDEVAFYDKALPAERIVAHVNAAK